MPAETCPEFAWLKSRARVYRPSPSFLKKPAQQLRGFALAQPAINFGRVMAGRLREKARPVLDGAAFRIACGEIKPPHAGKRDRRRAHGAGLQSHVQIAIGQPLRAKRAAGFANRQNFGVRRRIMGLQRPVAGAGDDRAVLRDDRPDRDLAPRAGRLRFLKGAGHRVGGDR